MIFDENDTRLLVSEALREQFLNTEDQQETSVDQNDIILIDLYVSNKDQSFSLSGPLVEIFKEDDDKRIEVQLMINLRDAHEIYSLIGKKNQSKCLKYELSYFGKSYVLEGPFNMSINKITNFNYKASQCLTCIELIRIEQ